MYTCTVLLWSFVSVVYTWTIFNTWTYLHLSLPFALHSSDELTGSLLWIKLKVEPGASDRPVGHHQPVMSLAVRLLSLCFNYLKAVHIESSCSHLYENLTPLGGNKKSARAKVTGQICHWCVEILLLLPWWALVDRLRFWYSHCTLAGWRRMGVSHCLF